MASILFAEIPHLSVKNIQIRTDRGWSLVFDDDLSKAVLDMKGNRTTDVSIICEAAKYFVKNSSSSAKIYRFLPTTFESISILPILIKVILHMLLDGSGIDQPPPGPDKPKPTASFGQHIIYKSVRRRSNKARRRRK